MHVQKQVADQFPASIWRRWTRKGRLVTISQKRLLQSPSHPLSRRRDALRSPKLWLCPWWRRWHTVSLTVCSDFVIFLIGPAQMSAGCCGFSIFLIVSCDRPLQSSKMNVYKLDSERLSNKNRILNELWERISFFDVYYFPLFELCYLHLLPWCVFLNCYTVRFYSILARIIHTLITLYIAVFIRLFIYQFFQHFDCGLLARCDKEGEI